jgi:NitT/TauT family transport system permease protein
MALSDGANVDAPLPPIALARRAPDSRRFWSSLVLARIVVFGGLLALWEVASGRWIDTFFVGRPTEIALRLITWIGDGTYLYHLEITVREALLGFAIGASLGLIVGLAMGSSSYLSGILEPLIMSLYSLPKVAFIPLLIVWFGIRIESKIALAALLVFFLVLFSTLNGVREVDRELMNAVRVMGADRRALYTKVIIPSALNSIFAGLRISLPQALVGAVVGELWAAGRGIGFLIGYTGSQFDVNGTFAALLGLLAVSLILSGGLGVVERRVLRWRRIAGQGLG